VGAVGAVVGLDLSEPMLELAAERAAEAGLAQVTFRKADVQVAELEPAWADAVISRMGVMFFADPVAAFANVLGGTRPGGRFVFACWRGPQDNPWVSVPMGPILEHVAPPASASDGQAAPAPSANPGMFAFAEESHVRQVLDDAGWVDVVVAAEDGPVSLGPDESVEDVVAYLLDDGPARHLLEGTSPAQRREVGAAVAEVLRPHAGPDGVVLQGGGWLVTARRG
jgi:SAM-dependent methyltransferase